MRTWTRLVAAVLLALPFTMATVRADPELSTDQKIAQLQKELRELRQDLDKLKNAVTESNFRGAATSEAIQKILDTVKRMDLAQRDLVTRRSAYAPTPSTDDIPLPTTATITVRNRYTAMATVRINGREFQVAPGQDARIPGVPVGPVNYEVEVDGFGVVQGLRTETLRPVGRILTVYPRYGG